jgi:hypothetical protein
MSISTGTSTGTEALSLSASGARLWRWNPEGTLGNEANTSEPEANETALVPGWIQLSPHQVSAAITFAFAQAFFEQDFGLSLFFLVELGFELRALYWLGRCSIA